MRKQKNNTSVRQKKGTGNTSARREKGTNGKAVWQEKDVRGQLFFENPDLCAEFLRDYSGIEILKNVQPEDIEKVDLRYHLFDEVTHHSDAVKRIRLKSETQGQAPASLYIISLVDHKSKVDFNAPMQLFRMPPPQSSTSSRASSGVSAAN